LVSRLKVWIPDTIVYHDLETNYWLYSNEACVVWRTDKFEPKTVISKLSNFCSQNELVGVQKYTQYIGNTKTKLLTANDLSYAVSSVSSSGGGKETCVIQRYIKSIGSKAFKVRTIWTKGQPPCCFIVTNNSSYYEYDGAQDIFKYMVVVSENQKGPSTIFKTNKGKQLTDTLPYVENIIKYFRGAFGVEVTKIAADFIKDESGIWWMINIKSISFKEKITEGRIRKVVNGEDDEEIGTSVGQSGPKRPEGYQKIKLCRYCETPFHAEDLNNKLNLKMVMELDKHLKVRGYNFDWLDRGERQFVDTSNLYEVHLVCKICFKLYEQMVQLNKYFEAFSTDCGIHFKSEKNDQTVSITTLKEKKVPELETSPSGLQNNDDGSEDEHDQHKSNNNNSKYDPAGIIRISNDTYLQQKPRLLNRFRFVTFLQCVNDIPVRQIKTHPPDSFSIEIDVLDQVLHYKIEMQYLQKQKDEPQVEGEKKKEFCRIDMNRLSVKYFFSHERQSLRTYIHQAKVSIPLTKTIEMRLRKNQEKEPLYAFQIELQDFVSEQVPTRNYQKYFTVDTDHINDLAWELVVCSALTLVYFGSSRRH